MSDEDSKWQSPQDNQATEEGAVSKPKRPKVAFRDESVPAEPVRTAPPAEPSRFQSADSQASGLPQPPSYSSSEPSRYQRQQPVEPRTVEPRAVEPVAAPSEPARADHVPDQEPLLDVPAPAEPRRTAPAPRPEPVVQSDDKIEIPKPASKHDAVGALRAMMSFYTIIPNKADKRDFESMDSNFYFSPFIGFIIGFMAALVAVLFCALYSVNGWMNPVVPVAAIALATPLVFSRFLHFDGLADFGDGFVCAGDRDKRLFALKDSAIGAGGFGVAFVVTLLSFSLLCGVGSIWAALIPVVIWTIEIAVKNAMVAAAAFGDPGTGMAGGQVRNTNRNTLILSTIIAAVLAFVALGICIGLMCVFGFTPANDRILRLAVSVLIILGMSVIVGYGMARLSNKRFGMVNGDILGATNEISRALMLLVAVIPLVI